MSSRPAMQAELSAICKEHNGVLRATDVVEFAADTDTALHEYFTWDDGDAAHQYRLWQARQVIRISVTVIPNREKPVRMFVSLNADQQESGGGYRTMVSVMKNKNARSQLLAEALQELEMYQEKYQELTELAPLFAAAKKIRRKREPVHA